MTYWHIGAPKSLIRGALDYQKKNSDSPGVLYARSSTCSSSHCNCRHFFAVPTYKQLHSQLQLQFSADFIRASSRFKSTNYSDGENTLRCPSMYLVSTYFLIQIINQRSWTKYPSIKLNANKDTKIPYFSTLIANCNLQILTSYTKMSYE